MDGEITNSDLSSSFNISKLDNRPKIKVYPDKFYPTMRKSKKNSLISHLMATGDV